MININQPILKITKKNIKYSLLFNKYQTFGYIYIFLGNFMSSISYIILFYIVENQNITPIALLLFFITLAFSFLFVYPMRMALAQSILYSREFLLEKFLIYLKDKLLLFNESNERKKYTALLRSNVSYVAKEYCDFYFHLFLSISILITSTAVLYYIHGFIYVIVVLFSLVIVFFSIKLISAKHKELSNEMENAENKLSLSLENSWEVLTLKSIYFTNIFSNNLNQSFDGLYKKTTFQEKYYRFRVTLISILVIFIFALTTFYLYYNDNFSLAQLVVTLPILNLILSHILNVSRELAYANNLEGRLEAILELQNLDTKVNETLSNLQDRIKFNKLVITELNLQDVKNFTSIQLACDYFLNKHNGLYSIKGENGAGKSSFLIFLTTHFNNYTYIPVNPKSHGIENVSTGQIKFKYILKQLNNIENNSVILIDEPYSNLSNQEKLYEILLKEAQKHLIIITTH